MPTCSPAGSRWPAADATRPPAICAPPRAPGTAARRAPAAPAGWPRRPGARRRNAGGACWPRATAAWPCLTCTCRPSAPPSCAPWPPPTARGWRTWRCGTRYAGGTPGCSWSGASAGAAPSSGSPRSARPPTASWWLTWPRCATSPPAWTARWTAGPRRPRSSGSAAGSRPPCASASCTPRRSRPARPNPSPPPTCSASWATPTCWSSPTSTASCTPSSSPAAGCTWCTSARPRRRCTRWPTRCSRCAVRAPAAAPTGSTWTEIGRRLEVNLLGDSVRLLAAGRSSWCRPGSCTPCPGG